MIQNKIGVTVYPFHLRVGIFICVRCDIILRLIHQNSQHLSRQYLSSHMHFSNFDSYLSGRSDLEYVSCIQFMRE